MSETILQKIEAVLIQHPEVRLTNTPPSVLASHMVESLWLLETSILRRSRHPFYNPTDINAP